MTERQQEGQGQKGPKRKPELVPFEELQFFDCYVERVGPGADEAAGGLVWVQLSDVGGVFERVWFFAQYFIANEVLAAALVAVQSGLICQVALTGTTDQSQIYRLHVIAASRQ
jgi:hypothetical protein